MTGDTPQPIRLDGAHARIDDDDLLTREAEILARVHDDPLLRVEPAPTVRRPALPPSRRPVLGELLAAARWEREAIACADDVRDALDRVQAEAVRVRLDDADRATLIARVLADLREWSIRDCRPLVRAILGGASAGSDDPAPTIVLADDEPAVEAVEGATLADQTAALLRRHVVMTESQADAVTLWLAAAYLIECLSVMPILLIWAATMRAGKTTLLMLLSALAPRALTASNITGAVLVRLIDRYRPTLLLDEADTWLRSDDADMRGVINAGEYRRTAYVYRCAPDTHEPQAIACFAARALAMIGRPSGAAATISDRAIAIGLRRRRLDEAIERMRLDTLADTHRPLRRQWRRWADDHADAIRPAAAELPDAEIPAAIGSDRARSHWRPLLAIADALGGDWPARARRAAVELSGGEADDTETTIELLRDIAEILADRDGEAIASADLLAGLLAMPDRPWPTWRAGRPMTERGLARLLGPLGAHADRHTLPGGRRVRAYRRAPLDELVARYLTHTPAPDPGDQAAIRPGPNVYGPDRARSHVSSDPTLDTCENLDRANNDGPRDAWPHRSAGSAGECVCDDDEEVSRGY